tara:strand:- start:1696 stop:3036 length:1341 start_codon:yes stop_codon:yes gene_type:complete
MSRRQAQALIWESCEHLIREFVESAFLSSPLPNPPLELPDFPAIVPKSSEALVDQSIGIYLIDKAGFNHRLTTIVNERAPDHVKRNIDPESAKQKWMSRNVNSISETLICRISRDWLSASLDEDSPDTDRWYMGVSLLIGLAISGSEVARKEGPHLLSSIAMAKKPGTWSRKTSGPHHIGWSPVGTFESIDPPHPSGVLAASNILDTLARAPPSSSQVLPFWLEDLTVNKQLCELLEVHRRLLDLLDEDPGNCEPVVRAAIQLLSCSPSESSEILIKASRHDNVQTRRETASSLQRIASDDFNLALSLMDTLLGDPDSDVRVISATYLSSIGRSDARLFIEKAKPVLERAEVRLTKRIVDSAIREYLSLDSFDRAGLLPLAWASSDQSTKSKLAGLIIQQSEVNYEGFTDTCRRFKEISYDTFNDLKSYILRRDSSMEEKLPELQD